MRQVTAILIGAGQRGADVYAGYALNFPNEFKIVGVAEPREERLQEFQVLHHIPEEHCFHDYREILSQPKMADCAMICTQDNMHFLPVKMAAEKGYHILCEKPMSSDPEELRAMGEIARAHDRVLSICHVLRYSPFFMEIKKLLESGRIGDLVSIQHIESVGYWHMAHSFVRGNWNSKERSSAIILQKCCHDMDILSWLVGSDCRRVSSFGNLSHFNKEHAPEGAPKRCLDGCDFRDACPFYAPRFYLEHPKAMTDGFARVVSADTSREALLAELETGPYGRCVYHCDNDVVDHQVVNLEYNNGVTVNFTMSAFTKNCERVIDLMGSKGQIRGNMEENIIEVLDFVSGNKEVIHLHVPDSGHSGSDVTMMREFVKLIALDGKGDNRNDANQAIASHLIALAAEESRVNKGKVVEL
ncbi:MAG: Gfo/Idh/MocA family oxidoreductase [Lachnospiraceae bacterium]|nr:Gfo/Idh/MocA family oxidoreductase [Lachnospiraceae bacterium]